ncbi:MAG: bifunctional adenosylcobinamide kinase/adenosylcobinamide-phosphate guanylyltransferase [Gammaproteobacteria bacterium]|nr:MAG: bifunctional adenosylcobinamide kinase/adenosylcobinamide-phosphate guanylyltransferase [Gammaproteobacteria bacterium]
MIYLVLGGARSGKSSYAESLAKRLSDKVVYMATASAEDPEMRARIALHQSERPEHWGLIEEKFFLSRELERIVVNSETNQTASGSVILIDCLTLWLSNWLCLSESDSADFDSWSAEKNSFIEQLKKTTCPIILVSNEVGSGIVPMGELSRQFVDQAGWLNQAIAAVAEEVVLVVAGLPITLKGYSRNLSKETVKDSGRQAC